MRVFGWIVTCFLIFVALVVVAFAFNIGGLEWKRFFGKYEADVQDDVWREGTPYREHKNQQLADYYWQWNQKPFNERSGIEASVRHHFGTYNMEEIYDPEIRKWGRRIVRGNNGQISQPDNP